MKDYSVMSQICRNCKHFKNKRFVHKRLKIGYCCQVDDGYSNDCLLD